MQKFTYVDDIDHGILFDFPTVFRRPKSNYLLFRGKSQFTWPKSKMSASLWFLLRHNPMDYLEMRFNICFNGVSSVDFYWTGWMFLRSLLCPERRCVRNVTVVCEAKRSCTSHTMKKKEPTRPISWTIRAHWNIDSSEYSMRHLFLETVM